MTEHSPGDRLLTEERRMIRDTAREFTLNEVLPVANRLDPVQGEIPLELRQKLADMGYFGIRVPEEYGGSGLGVFEYCLVAEQLARGWMSVASIIARGNGTMTLDLLDPERRRAGRCGNRKGRGCSGSGRSETANRISSARPS